MKGKKLFLDDVQNEKCPPSIFAKDKRRKTTGDDEHGGHGGGSAGVQRKDPAGSDDGCGVDVPVERTSDGYGGGCRDVGTPHRDEEVVGRRRGGPREVKQSTLSQYRSPRLSVVTEISQTQLYGLQNYNAL